MLEIVTFNHYSINDISCIRHYVKNVQNRSLLCACRSVYDLATTRRYRVVRSRSV